MEEDISGTLKNKEIKKRSKVVGEDFAPLFMHLKEKNGQKMKHMEKMWKIQGIPYIGLNFTSIGSRIYRQIGEILSWSKK